MIRISHHVLERISERAGADLTEADVLALVPARDLARMETGATVYARIKRLALDVVCRDRCLTTAMHSHQWRTAGPRVSNDEWRRRRDGRPADGRPRQAVLDADEVLVVGGRSWRVPA